MADARKNNGGARTGAGRKPKAEEQKLIEKLSPLDPIAFEALKNGLNEGESWAVKMHFEYMYGKPKESIALTSDNKLEVVLSKETNDLFGRTTPGAKGNTPKS